MITDNYEPRDPDWDDVPEWLAKLDGQQITLDGETSTLVVSPGTFGHERRLREGFYDGGDQ